LGTVERSQIATRSAAARRHTMLVLTALTAMLALVPTCAARAASASTPDPHEAIRHATLDFYVALNSVLNGDLGPMQVVWSHSADVSNLDSFGGRVVGWNDVLESYRSAARHNLSGKIVPTQIQVKVLGPIGYSICVESGDLRGSDQLPFKTTARATNIFVLEQGKWKMVHHHSDPTPESARAAEER
jgi:ketosteroid isomerase-like protein